jgi:hypothetical protein
VHISLCGVVTITFRVLSLFVVTKCYSCSEIENVIINCSFGLRTNKKSTHRYKLTSEVTNSRDNTIDIGSLSTSILITEIKEIPHALVFDSNLKWLIAREDFNSLISCSNLQFDISGIHERKLVEY